MEQGVLSHAEVQQVLDVQRRHGRPFGDLVERLYGVDPRAIESAWAAQYAALAGVDSSSELSFDPDCLALLNRRQAWQFHLLPVSRKNGELMLITDAPHLVRSMSFATASFTEPVFIKVVSSKELRALLMQYYPVPTFLADYAAKL